MKIWKHTWRGFLGAVILFWVVTTSCIAALAQAPGMSTGDHNKQLVQDAFDAWKTGTGSPFDLLSSDVSWTIVGNSVVSRTYNSREEFMGQVIRPFNARLKGHLVPTVHSIYAEGSTVVVYFDADSTALDGKPYHNTYAWFLAFEKDKVIRVVAFFDSVEFNDFWERVKPALPSGRE